VTFVFAILAFLGFVYVIAKVLGIPKKGKR
jgi:hypothetical protein